MKKIKKYLTIYLYVFIIFTSMLPTKENITNISQLKTIIPGIEKIYNNDKSHEKKDVEISFKIIEIIQNIF